MAEEYPMAHNRSRIQVQMDFDRGWKEHRQQLCVRWRSYLSVSTLILLQAFALSCQRGAQSPVGMELGDVAVAKAAGAETAQPLPVCPPAGLAPLERGTSGTGDHKVALTWNASAPSNGSDGTAVGYCLYRSKTQHAASKNPICKECEQVNRVPVKSTGCMDDLVADSTQYYYVVTAINSKGILSAAPAEIPVTIPPAHSVQPSKPSTLPLCRAGLEPQGH